MIDPNTLIQNDLILRNLKAATKESAFEQLIAHLYKIKPDVFGSETKASALEAILARGTMQTTCVGNHVAFPHARLKGWKNFTTVIGISEEGLDFDSSDWKPVHVICLMISSEEDPYLILKGMAAFSRLFHSVHHPLEVFEDKSNELDVLKDEIKKEKQIIAHDLMRPVKGMVNLETPVEEVARTMHLHHLDVLPVVDNQNHFFGTISCLDIFSYGIPDFFNQLHTVAFVRHIDPFEKYYKIRKDLKVKDLIQRDLSSAISKNNTLMEIIFQLTAKKHSKLFILDEGILAGEIDRFSIVDKILFY